MSVLGRCVALLCSTAWLALASSAFGEPAQINDEQRRLIEQRLQELKEEKKSLNRTMQDFDARIDELEAMMKGARPAARPKIAAHKPKPGAAPVASAEAGPLRGAETAVVEQPPPTKPIVVASAGDPPAMPGPSATDTWGDYGTGQGFVVVRSKDGELRVSLIAYVRYLNQLSLDDFYTDSFGRTKELDLRQDVLLNKVNLSFKGWLIDPNFEYRIWVWTQNPAMGDLAQVVVGGHLGYHFSEHFNVFGGVAPLPTDRTTNWTYPMWLKMDNRTLADEFFRGSYTFGFWADGDIDEGLKYRVMIANNLSALGISASQLDSQFATVSGSVWWMPTTGEYGPTEEFGDYANHQEVATRFGVHYTRSREDKQSQPDTDAIENSQIRLSDGTLLFSPNAFDTDGQVNRATYQMTAFNAGIKYQGWAFEGEYYARWVDDFKTTGFVPVDSLFDQGVSLYGSVMAIPEELQLYVAASKVFGEYGDPWDTTVGLNWYPFSRREIRVNAEGIYMDRSPVGGNAYPYLVGADGWLFNTDFIITF